MHAALHAKRMDIENNFLKTDPVTEMPCKICTPDGACHEKTEMLIHEHFVEISVNLKPAVRLACSPQQLVELIIGCLYTGGMIDGADDVEKVFICGTGNIAEITLARKIEMTDPVVTEPTCCTGNRLLSEPVGKRKMTPLKTVKLNEEAVYKLAERFKEDSALHRMTSSAHSCYLYQPGGEISEFEDISRHNAMDKAVGYALINGISLSDCMLYTTGRVPEDMVQKAVMSGVPVLISKSMPTDTAVELADKYGLTLIYNAWPDGFKIASRRALE